MNSYFGDQNSEAGPSLEDSLLTRLLGDEQDCVENLGEDLTSAVKEALNYE